MKKVATHRLTVVLSALLLSGTAAFAQSSMSQDADSGRRISATVDSSVTTRAIQSTEYDARAELLSGIEARMNAADSILSSFVLPESAKKEVKAVSDALTESIRKARNSTAADWAQVRLELSDRYTAFAEVAIRTEQSASAKAK
jgi:formiminotetrahydrofolate cyclodeaminase